jgi:hypothetical protein
MSNPYESPRESGSPFSADPDREKLRRIARYQRWVLYALLANIILNISAVALRQQGPAVNLLIGLAVLAVVLVAIVAVFLLAKELFHVAIAVLCAMLMIVPCISLLTLAIVNQKATTYLQVRGIRVGFMGVDPSRI